MKKLLLCAVVVGLSAWALWDTFYIDALPLPTPHLYVTDCGDDVPTGSVCGHHDKGNFLQSRPGKPNVTNYVGGRRTCVALIKAAIEHGGFNVAGLTEGSCPAVGPCIVRCHWC